MNVKPVILSSLIFSVLVGSGLTEAITVSFNDVTAKTDYRTAIYWAVQEGVASGYGNGNWGPDDCVKRAELIKMVMESKPGSSQNTAVYKKAFPDIKKADWFYKYANDAREAGYIDGYADGYFRGYQCVNRAEAMKIAINVLFSKPKLDNSANDLYFDDKRVVDISNSDWFMPYARFLFMDRLIGTNHTVSAGMASNVPLIKFLPAGEMSRKEVAQMLYLIIHSDKWKNQI